MRARHRRRRSIPTTLSLRFLGLLHAWPVLAPHAHGLLTRLDLTKALEEPGVIATLTADDVPGEADSGANRHDEPLIPIEVTNHSQPVAWVLGETQEAARLGALRVEAEYRALTPVLTIPGRHCRAEFSLRPVSHSTEEMPAPRSGAVRIG